MEFLQKFFGQVSFLENESEDGLFYGGFEPTKCVNTYEEAVELAKKLVTELQAKGLYVTQFTIEKVFVNPKELDEDGGFVYQPLVSEGE